MTETEKERIIKHVDTLCGSLARCSRTQERDTLREKVAELTAERDALWYEVAELSRRLDDAIGRDWRESVYEDSNTKE